MPHKRRVRTPALRRQSKATPASPASHSMVEFLALRVGPTWRWFLNEHPSFWAICAYLLVEYVRPQSIWPALDILPWGKMLIVATLLTMMFDKRKRWVSDPANKWMVLFLFVVVTSSVAAFWPEKSWPEFMHFFGWFTIYFLVINIVNTQQRLFFFLGIFILASFKMSLHGARTWASRGFSYENWGLTGPEGPFENSGEFSLQMLMFMPIAYRLITSMRPWIGAVPYWLLQIIPVTAIMTVAGASSRGSQAGLAVQIFHTFLRGRLSIRKVAGVVVVATAIGLLIPQEQIARFREAGEDSTSRQRLLYWKHGLDMIIDHPVLGVGYFNYSTYYQKYFPEDVLFREAELPHNIFIQVGTDAGLIGLTIYVMLIASAFMANRQIRRQLREDPAHWLLGISHAYDAALIGFLIAGQFVSVVYYPFMWILLAMIVATRNVVASCTSCAPPATPGRNRRASR